jgi:hypothetical protein
MRPVAKGFTMLKGGVRRGLHKRAARVGLAWRHYPTPYPPAPGDAAGATIVEYTDREPACNEYPVRIVSPPHPGPCCGAHMVSVGAAREDERWVVQYRRCTRCGFTVRRILHEIPDGETLERLRRALASAFARCAGELT